MTTPTRVGFGSTIIRRSFIYDLDGETSIRFAEGGLEADFVIPAKFVTFVSAAILTAPQKEMIDSQIASAPLGQQPLAGMSVLLVEDNLIIAMNGEDILKSLGAAEVIAVPNVSQALAALDRQPLQMALLDVNLGVETSFPIADRLMSMNIPFGFVTGYGDSIPQGDTYADIPVLQKPYTWESIEAFLPVVLRPRDE